MPEANIKNKKNNAPARLWYVVLRTPSGGARVYASNSRVDVILQAYMSLKESARKRAVICYAVSPEKAKTIK